MKPPIRPLPPHLQANWRERAPRYPAPTVRHLLYHVYPIAGNGRWQWNVEQVCRRLPLFNGRRVVAIAADPPGQVEPARDDTTGLRGPRGTISGTDTAEAVQAEFARLGGTGVEFIVFENDPTLREVLTFESLWSRVADPDPQAVTCYMHAKSVTRPAGPHQRWTEILYEAYLDYWPLVSQILERYHAAGCFRKIGQGWPAERRQADWYYMGSFAWWRNDHIFLAGHNWRDIERWWGGIEPWLALHVKKEDAGCIFWQGWAIGMAPEHPVHLREIVEPDWAAWRAEHEAYRWGPDEMPCQRGQHRWVTKRLGGPPDMAESLEAVRYCDLCGMEDSEP